MNFVGIDLHKKSISICVVNQAREVLAQKRFMCNAPTRIVDYFESIGPFSAVVEATTSYEWLMSLLEPLAERMVLAHPRKMRLIAESTRKSDKLDARILAEFLALDMIPEAYRPTKRERAHRILVRQRYYINGCITATRNKIRHVLADYNADRVDLFTQAGLEYLTKFAVRDADRTVLDQLVALWRFHCHQLKEINQALKAFAEQAPAKEAEARAVLNTIPGVGPVTIDVVVSELGNIERFRSQKKVCAYAGLVPKMRESDGKGKNLGITKEGPKLMRWALIQAAWRITRTTNRWRHIFENLAKRRGKRKAIVAIARRLLCVMTSMLQRGQAYSPAMA